MRQTWRSGWLALAAGVGVWHCAIDDRSPQQVSTPNQPGDAGVPGAMTPPSPTGAAGADSGAAGAAGAGTGAAGAGAGAAGAGTGGAGTGGTTGTAGAGTAGTTGNSGAAGAAGSGPMGMSGAGGIDPFDPFTPPASSSTCPAFAACGGELAGAWSYSEDCTDLSGSLGILQVVCPTASVRVEPGGAATLTFAGGQVTRQGAPQGDGVITLPGECEDIDCIELAAAQAGSGQCSVVNGDCICRSAASVTWSTQPYTVTGGQLTLQDGRSFDYCVQGDTLTYRETGMAQEPGTFTLQRN
ncbi:MAG: hypothetical protein ABI895_33825 [Deltaproteobacteria bacterium]